jgi:outer membrane protein OmpA-like peptidoglycan-associated protein
MSEQLRGSESSAVASTLREDLATMTENASTLTRQNNALRYEVQTLRSRLNRTRLFVEKVDDLPAAAKELFVELSKLETTEGAVLQHEYDRIKKEVGANIIDTIKFSTGSSQVSLDKVEEITRVVGKANPQSYFLVVGYASKTGNFEDNKKLSAERATTIASVVDYKKMDTQGIQAVFLGQTDRFSGSDVLQNQICEVWEIMP